MNASRSRFLETVHSALASLRAHKLRSALTTLGIIIGVASVITVVDLTQALETRIMAEVGQEGTHIFFLSSWVPLQRRTQARITRMPMDPGTVRELQVLVPGIRIASPQTSLFNRQGLILKSGSLNRRLSYITAIDEYGLELGNLDLACGRSFTATDRLTRANVAILGAKVAEDLGFTEASLGRTFTVNGQTAELVGILKPHEGIPFVPQDTGEDADMWGPDGMFYVPFGSFRELARPGSFDNAYWTLQVDGAIPVGEAQETIREALRRIRGLHGSDVDNFMLESNSKAIEKVEKIGRTLMLASGAMVGISLLVGGIGVMNIMLVSVTERTREIGVRKALGARRKHILIQFLIEAVALCLVGGLIGLVVGLGFGTLLSQLLMKHLGAVPFWALAASLMVPASVGLLFGLYPAAKASKLDPIEALRYE